MSKFSAPFPQAHLIYIHPFHSETKSYTITFVFSYILSLRCFIGVEKQKGLKEMAVCISVYVQLFFVIYIPKYLKFVYFLAGSGVARSQWLLRLQPEGLD